MNFLRDFLAKLDDLPAFIEWAGYAGMSLNIFAETGLLIGVVLPGDSLLIAAGILASHGFLNVWWLGAMLTVAATAGNQTGYWIGRSTGPRVFAREDSRFFKRRYAVAAEQFYLRHGPKAVVVARFVPFVRTFAPVVAGVAKMNYRTFLLYDLVGGVLWIWSLLLTAYYLGRAIPGIEHQLGFVILAVVAISLVPPAWVWWSERSAARRQRLP